MKYFFNSLSEIRKKIQSQNCIFMFDFDGTLSKITKTPEGAYIKKSTKNLLNELSKKFFVAIISGRALLDVESKVGLPNLIYAGNHGLEWKMGRTKEDIKIPAKYFEKIKAIKKDFLALVLKYKGLLLEDKNLTVSLHYRLLSKESRKIFLKEIFQIISLIKKDTIFFVTKSKKTIEIRPRLNWNKGIFADFLVRRLERVKRCSLLAFYIGDDRTDEDAFKIFKKGITLRMGKKQKSEANYFIKINEIDKLLRFINNIDFLVK